MNKLLSTVTTASLNHIVVNGLTSISFLFFLLYWLPIFNFFLNNQSVCFNIPSSFLHTIVIFIVASLLIVAAFFHIRLGFENILFDYTHNIFIRSLVLFFIDIVLFVSYFSFLFFFVCL